MLSFLHLLGFGDESWSYQFLVGALATLKISIGAFVTVAVQVRR